MRRTLLVVCLGFGLAVLFARAGSRDKPCQAFTVSVDAAMQSVARIHPGLTRADVEKEFEMDGGLQSVTPSRYVLKKCPDIKVDIEFKAADGGQPQISPSSPEFSPTDLVVKVGKPYLEYPDMD